MLAVICDDLWWLVVVGGGRLWWLAVVCDGCGWWLLVVVGGGL